MITIPELTAQALGTFLTSETKGRFGASYARLPELLPFAAKLALECIGNSDALYHNIEHTMLVTLVGHDILMGRAFQRPQRAITLTLSLGAYCTISVTFAESSTETKIGLT